MVSVWEKVILIKPGYHQRIPSLTLYLTPIGGGGMLIRTLILVCRAGIWLGRAEKLTPVCFKLFKFIRFLVKIEQTIISVLLV